MIIQTAATVGRLIVVTGAVSGLGWIWRKMSEMVMRWRANRSAPPTHGTSETRVLTDSSGEVVSDQPKPDPEPTEEQTLTVLKEFGKRVEKAVSTPKPHEAMGKLVDSLGELSTSTMATLGQVFSNKSKDNGAQLA